MEGLNSSGLVVVFAELSLYDDACRSSALANLMNVLRSLSAVSNDADERVEDESVLRRTVYVGVVVISMDTTTVGCLARVINEGVNDRACDGAIAAVCRRVEGLNERCKEFLRNIIRIIRRVGNLLIRIIRSILARLERSTLDVARHDEEITIRETRIALSVGRDMARIPLLARAGRNAVREEIAV